MTLAAMAAYTIINPSYSDYIDIYNKLLRSIEIKSMWKFSSSKYALRRKNWFLINKKPKKRKLGIETDNIITE